jgi:hypothetical protein
MGQRLVVSERSMSRSDNEEPDSSDMIRASADGARRMVGADNDDSDYQSTSSDHTTLNFVGVRHVANCHALQNPNSVIDSIWINLLPGNETPADNDKVRHLLENHNTLKKVTVAMCSGTSEIKGSTMAVALGLQANRSVQAVTWLFTSRGEIPDDVCLALKDLVTKNTTIRCMHFSSEAVGPRPATSTNVNNLEDCLFDGLRGTRLHTFRYDMANIVTNHNKVRNGNKKKAWRAMKENPHIKRIKADFENEDYMLDLLIKDKENQWTNQWLQLNDNDCWNVMEEAIAACDLDPVFVIYHFLRSRPEVVLPLCSVALIP